MKTFKMITLGCKVNQYETQLMREKLLQFGMIEVNSNTPADFYVINTCTVTVHADRESRRFIRHSIKENPAAAIVATGCYIEKDADVIKEIDEKIIIISNRDKENIVKKMGTIPIFADMVTKAKMGQPLFFISRFKDRTKAFIKIQDGCDNFCSYCKVPYVRGASRSRNRGEIIQEAQALLKNNYKELVLTGVCLGAYGKGLYKNRHCEERSGPRESGEAIPGHRQRPSLKNILEEIANLSGDFRIRLSSIEMQDINRALVDIIKNTEKICNHLHIPLQSGDSEILKKMNRKYSQAQFIKKIQEIRRQIPDIAISTDIIIGFPGETEAAFENTIKCIKIIKPMRVHIFSYSPRAGTAARNFKPEVGKKIIAERCAILREITDRIALEYQHAQKNMAQRILVENTRDKKTNKLCGYTDTYVKAFLDGTDEKIGKFSYLN